MIRKHMGVQRGVQYLCFVSPSPNDIPQCRRYSTDSQHFDRKSMRGRREQRPRDRELPPPNNDTSKNDYYIKLLCPSLVTELMPEYGSMWMKGIMNQSSAKVTMSLDGEHFPFTEDRVIAISGTYISITHAIDAIVKDMLQVSSTWRSAASECMICKTCCFSHLSSAWPYWFIDWLASQSWWSRLFPLEILIYTDFLIHFVGTSRWIPPSPHNH